MDDAAAEELSAHVVVVVNVTDENDNLPMFVNLPYHCTVSGDAKQGKVIQKVSSLNILMHDRKYSEKIDKNIYVEIYMCCPLIRFKL